MVTEVELFIQQYARKAERGMDPNDRAYNHKLEERIKRMDPIELDELMHGDEDSDVDSEGEIN